MAKHLDCYAIDLLGNGNTDKPDYDYHIPLVAAHVRDFMDSMGLAKASILGTSNGSRVAARFAVDYPDRVAKLILVSPGGLRYVPEDSAKIRANSLKAIEDLSWDSNRRRLEGLMKYPSAVSRTTWLPAGWRSTDSRIFKRRSITILWRTRRKPGLSA